MATYEVDVGGKTYEVDAPDPNTAWQWANYTHQQSIAAAEPQKKSTIGSEIVRGGKQLGSSVRTGIESLLGGAEDAAIAGVKRSEEISKEAGEGVSFEALKKAYEERGLLSAAGEVASQIPRALAGQVPQLAAMAGGAKLGATLASPLGPAGIIGGGVLGAGATLLPQFFGSNIERQASEQMAKDQPVQIDRGAAGVAAAGQAAVESAGTAFVLGKRIVKGVLGVADEAALATAKAQQAMTQAAERSIAAAAGRGVAKGAVVEMPVEIAQSVIERAQAGLDVTSPEALAEYGETAYQAGLVGGAIGAGAGPVDTAMARQGVKAKQEFDAAESKRAADKAAEDAAKIPPLALGVSEPFKPVVFPDGSVATTPEDVALYEQQQFEKKYASQAGEQPYTPAPSLTGTDMASRLAQRPGDGGMASILADRRVEQENARIEEARRARVTPESEGSGRAVLSADRGNADLMSIMGERRAAEEQAAAKEAARLARVESQQAKKQAALLGEVESPMMAAIRERKAAQDAADAAAAKLKEEEAQKAEAAKYAVNPSITKTPMPGMLGRQQDAGGDLATMMRTKREEQEAKAEVPLDDDYAFLQREKQRLLTEDKTPQNKLMLERIDERMGEILKRDIENMRKDKEKAATSVFGEEKLPAVEERDVVVGNKELAELQAPTLPSDEKVLGKEARQLRQLEKQRGEPAPAEDAQMRLEQAEMERRKFLRSKDANDGNLMKLLEGKLALDEVSDIAPKGKGFEKLANKNGTDISELISDGLLDDFLPPDERVGMSNFDAQKSAETIKEKLRNKDLSTFDKSVALRQLDDQIAALEQEAKQPSKTEFDASEVEPGEAASIERSATEQDVGDATDVRYQRSTAAGPSIGVDRTSEVVDATKSKWSNAPKVVVAENMDDPVIPKAVREHNAAAVKRGAKGKPKGFFYKGKAYILADAMSSDQDVIETLFHESLGHYGLRGTFGPEMGKVLADIVKNRRTEVETKAEQYGLDPKNPNDMLEAAEEVLAVMAQTKPGLPFVRRALAIIRNFLRDLGFNIKLSDADIIQKYILPARAFVERGGSKAVEGKPSAMRGEGAKSDRQIYKDADAIAAMDDDVRDNMEVGQVPGGPEAYNMYEARKMLKKPSDKLKRVTDSNSFSLWQDWEYIANIDGEYFGVTKEEDPDAVDDEDAFVYSYARLDDPRNVKTTVTSDAADLISEIRADSVGGKPSASREAAKTGPLTAAFKKWSGGAPVIELQDYHEFRSGEPVVVEALHGTTNADLNEFKRSRANIESDMGAGFYASNTPEDVEKNYANVDGPDLTQRVEQLAERLEDDFDGDMDAARQEARKRLSEGSPNTMKLYMRFKNPAVLGDNETFLDYSEEYNEETDEYKEPTGLLVDFVEALRDVAPNFNVSDREIESAIGKIFDQAEGDGLKISDALSTIKSELLDAFDDEGNSASSEVFRQALSQIGFDGVIDTTVYDKFGSKKRGGMKGMNEGTVHFIAFKPGQIKSATGNTGTYDPENTDIRYQRDSITGKPILSQWTTPTDTKLAGEIGKDDLIYALQNKMIDTKRVVDAISSTAGKIMAKWNPYLQEELYHGRTAKQTKDFLTEELRPLMQAMEKDGVSIADMEEYLKNRHAIAYNAQVAKVNPKMPDGGSGIKTADAQAYLSKLPPADKAKYEALAKRVDSITKGTRKILVDGGLETQETIDNWEVTFPFYVPLKRGDIDYAYTAGGMGTGQGFDVRGDFSRRAMGSEREATDVLANVAMMRERAIVKAQKNRVAQALFGLAAQNPNPEFWLPVDPLAEVDPANLQELLNFGLSQQDLDFIAKEPRQKAIDKNKNEVVERINATLRNNENVISMRFNGQNRYVFFNPNNERSKRMVESLKNLDAEQLGNVLGPISKLTRWMAAVNTQYNPVFGAYNFLRDVQGASLQLSDTPLAKDRKAVVAGTLPALKGIYAAMRAERDGKKVSGQWSDLWTEFQEEGGQTGFRDQFSRSQERAEALQKELNMIKEGKLKSAGRAALNWLSDYNDSMENAVRLSAYKAALDKGIGKEEAASIAKNLTVNFNRKGQIAVQAGALYAFFNAAMQGTTRLIQTLRGPAGKKIIAGGLLLGAMQASLLAAAGFDDEEPPEFVRERNLILPIGGGKYLAFPMPLGYHVIPSTSRILTEWALSGFKNTPDRIASLTGMYLEAFNPIGNAGWSAQTLAPTFADPIVALTENRDWTGKPIARKDFSNLDPTPGYTRAKDAASEFSTQIAKFLNYASGGTEFKPGVLSPTPDQLDYLIGQATGGVGRELLKVEQTISKTATGEELPSYKIPLAGRFYGETSSSAAESGRFYKNLTMLNEHENEIKGRRENREPIAEYLAENPEARLAEMGRKTYVEIQNLKKRKTKLLEADAPRESIQSVEKMITRKMQMLNNRVRALQDA